MHVQQSLAIYERQGPPKCDINLWHGAARCLAWMSSWAALSQPLLLCFTPTPYSLCAV